MNTYQELMQEFDIEHGTSVHRAIYKVRGILEGNADPLYAANKILRRIGIKESDNARHAFTLVMTAMEQAMRTETPSSIERIIELANSRTHALRDILGPYGAPSQIKPKDDVTSVHEGKKRNRTEHCMELYMEHRAFGDKHAIEAVRKAFGVTAQTAYIYVHKAKKSIEKG